MVVGLAVAELMLGCLRMVPDGESTWGQWVGAYETGRRCRLVPECLRRFGDVKCYRCGALSIRAGIASTTSQVMGYAGIAILVDVDRTHL